MAGLRSSNPRHPYWMPGREPGDPFSVTDYAAARRRMHAAQWEFAQAHDAVDGDRIDWHRYRRALDR